MSRRYGFLVGMVMVAMVLMIGSSYAVSLAGLEHDRGFIQVGNKLFERFEVNSVDAVGNFIVNGADITVTPFFSGSGEGLAFDGLIQANCQLTLPACHTNNDGKSSYIDMFFTYDIRTTDGKSLSDFGITFNGTTSGAGSSTQIIEAGRLGEMVMVSVPSMLSDHGDFALNGGDIVRITTRIILVAGNDPNGYANVSHFTEDFSLLSVVPGPPVIPQVPEPGTWLLFMTGIAGLIATHRWCRRRV